MPESSTRLLFILAVSLAATTAAPGQTAKGTSKAPASQAELAAIEERGEKLYLYEIALSASLQALQQSNIKTGSANDGDRENFSSLVQLDQRGFRTAFGRLGGEQHCYFIDFLVEGKWQNTPNKTASTGKAVFLSPPKEDQSTFLAMARALSLVKEDKEALLPYKNHHYAVLPGKSADSFYVYFYPRPKDKDSYFLGHDLRVQVEANKVKERRVMHRTILSFPNKTKKNEGRLQPVMGVHSAVVDELPEDTDVMHVLLRKPATNEMVITKTYLYEIEKSGRIKYRGPIKSFLKGRKEKAN
ncbi:MAG: hypothetical protein SFV17_19845 [Candidatus Obscuribacter sp.]|nr:hypothetical protein [Candidatus Melainabacteria bacterium]MDX1988949.1 hypothetical protein [Candidatus Obscuribacter sp.]